RGGEVRDRRRRPAHALAQYLRAGRRDLGFQLGPAVLTLFCRGSNHPAGEDPMRETEPVVPGNEQVVDGLQKALARAQTGIAKCVALIFCEHAGADVMYLGDVSARAQVVYGCELLNHLLATSSSMNVRRMDETRSASLVKYALTADPICFDFLPWLVTADMRRRQEQQPGPLKVAFVRHPTSLAPVT